MNRTLNGISSRRCFALVLATVFELGSSARMYAAESLASSPAQGAVPLEVFTGPKLKKATLPDFPKSEFKSHRDGWVRLNYMIDTAGKPYEIAVSDSTGNPVLEALAVESVRDWQYEPATLNGAPVDSSHSEKVVFSLKTRIARLDFRLANRRALDAIEVKDQAAADAALASIPVTNLYEDAYYNLTRFRYFALWGSKAEQLDALTRAIAYENGCTYLPEDMFVDALIAKMALSMEVNDFAEVMGAWRTLQKLKIKRKILAQWAPIIADLEALKSDGRSYGVAGSMLGATSWRFELYKNKFSIDVARGRIAEIKLRCEKKYLFFSYDPTLRYSIGNNSGSCSMELIGDKGTEFLLTQS